jgi:hypothetical protein
MYGKIRNLGLLFLLLFVAACGRDGQESRGPASPVPGPVRSKLRGRPVLLVVKTEFGNSDFRAYLEATGSGAKDLPAESLSRLFDTFVDEMLLLEAARERGISLSEDEKKEYVARLAVEDTPGGGPEASEPKGIFDRLLVEKYTFLVVRDIHVEDGEIVAYYEHHKKDFLYQGRVQVSQILVDTEEKAVSVLRRLERTGEAEFRKIARGESLGLPADMEKVIFALDEGRTSQIVESSYGFHVFRLDRKYPPALQTVTEAAPEIGRRILAQKMKDGLAAHLAGLKDTMTWRALPENLFFTYQRLDE